MLEESQRGGMLKVKLVCEMSWKVGMIVLKVMKVHR